MKNKLLAFFTFILLFICINIYPASISGRITFKNGKPVHKLKIICESTYTTFVDYTDSNGMYKFNLSAEIHTYYYVFIALKDGTRVRIGKVAIHGTHETVDARLLVNSYKDLK